MPIVNLNLTVVVNKRNYDSVSLRTGCLDGRTRGRERTVSSDSGNDLGSLSLPSSALEIPFQVQVRSSPPALRRHAHLTDPILLPFLLLSLIPTKTTA